jgi:ABC-type amino acid transport substrate-binding protein
MNPVNLRPHATAILLCLSLLFPALCAAGTGDQPVPSGDRTNSQSKHSADKVPDQPSGKQSADGRLVVGIHLSPPFVIADTTGNWSGLSIDLWRSIAQKLSMFYRFEPMELEDLLAALKEGKVDLAVGALSMTPEREKLFDFTHPYISAGLGIALPAESGGRLSSVLAGLLSPQLLHMFLIISVWLLMSGGLVWFFEHRRNPRMFGGDTVTGVGSGFWWALVTLTTVGYGDKSPITLGGRITATLWMIVSLVVLSSLTAAITSSLTVNRLTAEVSGPRDLHDKRVATVRASASAEWLADQGIEFKGYQDLNQALDSLEQGDSDAVVYDAPILNFAIRNRDGDKLHILDSRFHTHFNAFALPQGSDKLEALNYAILDTLRSRYWQRIQTEYLGSRE